MTKEAGVIIWEAADTEYKMGDIVKSSQCRALVISVGTASINASVYPTLENCTSCLLSDVCSKSLDKKSKKKS